MENPFSSPNFSKKSPANKHSTNVKSHYSVNTILIHIYSLMSFFIGNQGKFRTNSSVHNINTRNKHHLHRPVANLSCFKKGASYSGIRIFNSLPRSITNLKNEKTQFKVTLKMFLNAYSFYSVDEFFTCTDDMYCWLYDCVNLSYTVTLLLFVCLWHVEKTMHSKLNQHLWTNNILATEQYGFRKGLSTEQATYSLTNSLVILV
jgi:hypothetical protein